MSVRSPGRRLTGAVKNAVVWGGAWFTLAFVTMLALRTTGVVVPPEIGVLDMIGMALRVGIVGGVAGGLFAAFVSVFYRGRRLSDIDWVRFGTGGAVVAELFLLAFFTIPGLVSGEGFPALEHILSDLIVAPVFGGIAAGASMWLAQRVEAAPDAGEDAPERLARGDAAASLDASDARQREHAPPAPGGDR